MQEKLEKSVANNFRLRRLFLNFGRYLIKFVSTAFYYHDIMVMSRVGFIFALSIFRQFMISKKSYCFLYRKFKKCFSNLAKENNGHFLAKVSIS